MNRYFNLNTFLHSVTSKFPLIMNEWGRIIVILSHQHVEKIKFKVEIMSQSAPCDILMLLSNKGRN